ncbi:phage regulatory CII family protein [Neoaquamicrobium sediminum]|uniref:phage regulatory CII family protein n=1 Tax=Neoaquamicrobium sediminum TaxID=1849104 RepID=UPI003BAD0970
MIPNANARHFLLKAKQRDLIAACGGQIRSAEICHYGKSTVGRWADTNSPELMPLDAIFALEEECGRFDVSEAIAQARGQRFADAETGEEAANACVMERHANAMVQIGELMTTAALAFSDGKLTPAEATQLDRIASRVERAMEDLRKATASARGAGGISLVAGGQG